MTGTPHEIKEAWLNQALRSARIDRACWGPERGVDENRRTIEAVYDYYARLFLAHPQLEWAGMASMVGPAFYAGFRDLGLIPDAVRRAVRTVLGRASQRLAGRLAGDLGFYETTFLTMQKKIFEDQAVMHEAYVTGGVDEIATLYGAGIIDEATLQAWRQIDDGRIGGDAASVDRGNRTLLFREQHDIIDSFYVQMLQHSPPEGVAFTYLLTLAGAPSIPGARSYPERYPLTFSAGAPRLAVSLRTPLADGNIAVFADRWKLIESDTLPRCLDYVRHHPDEARAVLGTPIAKRVGPYRLFARAGSLVLGAITGWDVDVGPRARPSDDGRGAPPSSRADARARPTDAPPGVLIDVTGPPTRESAGLAKERDSRIWMDRKRRPFDVTVALPRRGAYRARAESAMMLSTVCGGDPDRLAVQLPPAGFAETATLLAAYAAEWGFALDTVADWRAGYERRRVSDRSYSTHVFTPEKVGFVHLEFQVSHHVREGYFVVAALLSWHAPTATAVAPRRSR